jgi:hypothetical protein
MTGVTPKLSTATPPKGLASLSTINAAITPWRDAFAEQTSLPLLIIAAGSCSHKTKTCVPCPPSILAKPAGTEGEIYCPLNAVTT